MNFKTLLEELKDIPTHNVLYHGTSGNKLFHILLSGKLKPRYYQSTLTDKPEIATGRKSMISSKEEPSANMRGVLITLFKDRIIGSKENRGVKVKSIAEFPAANITRMNEFKKMFGKELTNFLDELYKKNQYYFDSNKDAEENKVNEKLKELKREAPENVNQDHFIRYFQLKNRLKKLTASGLREKEERIYFNKEKNKNPDEFYTAMVQEYNSRHYGIPVDNRFMKIEITNPQVAAEEMVFEPTVSLENYFNIKDFDIEKASKIDKKQRNEIIKKLIELVKKYENVFVKNEKYKEFISLLEKEIE